MGIFAAPILKHAGWIQSADMLYSFFSRICHQDEARSFSLEGEKIGVCFRCTAIYFGFLFGLMLLPFTRAFERKEGASPGIFFLAVVPMLVDVLLNVSGLHASTTATRIMTGALFGAALPWFVVPILLEALLKLTRSTHNHSPDSGVISYVRKTR
jgi:uncharacterized membrane protein